MKQLLFLLLFPCLALAQYQGNGNQKITLGEQTSADGLVYRGLAADTTRKPSVDTMAFILLDTNTNIIWQYKKATNNAWTRVGGSISSGLTGVLPVANGGTNVSSLTSSGVLYASSSSQVATSSNLTFTTSGLQIGNDNDDYNNIQILNKNTTPNTNRRGGIAVRTFENDSLVGIVSTFSSSSARVLTFGGGVSNFKNPTGIRFMTSLNTVDPATRGSLTRMQIDSIGNIGINTTSPSERLHVLGNARITGNIALGITSATARLHLAQGTATASTAPLKFTSGTNLTTAEAGAMEFNGTNLLFTPSTTRHTVNHGLTGSATLNFPSTTTLLSADLTITVTGAADGDVVSLGVPNAAVNANTSYSAWVSAANTVTVRFNNYSSGTVDPASGTFKVFVTK